MSPIVPLELEQRLEAAGEALRQTVAQLDPDALSPAEAAQLIERFDRVARAATTGSTLLARRVADGEEWRRAGYRSAAEFLAAARGTSLAGARRNVDTSEALKDLPATREQMARGELSPEQGETIADAARADPDAEAQLLRTARRSNLNELRDEALRAKAAADRSAAERHERIRRARRVRRYTDAEGARHLDICGPVDAVATIEAELDRRISALVQARGRGQPLDPHEALGFDAMVDLARRSQRADDPAPGTGTGKRRQPPPQHLALLRLDVEALWRGYTEGDELCEVTGLGPIPVEVARRLLGDAVLRLVLTKGEAVAHVTSLTRGPNQAMRYALLWTSPFCTVEGCTRTVLEADHRFGAEYRHTRHTRLDELDHLCITHHQLRTHHGWALVVGTGKRPLVPPDHPDRPANASRASPAPDVRAALDHRVERAITARRLALGSGPAAPAVAQPLPLEVPP